MPLPVILPVKDGSNQVLDGANRVVAYPIMESPFHVTASGGARYMIEPAEHSGPRYRVEA